jgi:hypothetical protein
MGDLTPRVGSGERGLFAAVGWFLERQQLGWQIFTFELNPGAADRAERTRSAWNDCRWKVMGAPDAR